MNPSPGPEVLNVKKCLDKIVLNIERLKNVLHIRIAGFYSFFDFYLFEYFFYYVELPMLIDNMVLLEM